MFLPLSLSLSLSVCALSFFYFFSFFFPKFFIFPSTGSSHLIRSNSVNYKLQFSPFGCCCCCCFVSLFSCENFYADALCVWYLTFSLTHFLSLWLMFSFCFVFSSLSSQIFFPFALIFCFLLLWLLHSFVFIIYCCMSVELIDHRCGADIIHIVYWRRMWCALKHINRVHTGKRDG